MNRAARFGRFAPPRLLSELLPGLLFVLLWVLLSGCATYSDKLASVRQDTDRGAYPAAIERLNDVLGVKSIEEHPAIWTGEQPLAVLERGVLLQTIGEYALSAHDFSGAEAELESLDLGNDVPGHIGKFIYSDASGTYGASPTERLALNAMNMANYLALADLSGTAVEARRFTNMRDYLASIGLGSTGTFGAYLAGFAFERLGEEDRALRYYEEALEGRLLQSLAGPVARLAARNPYRGPRITALLNGETARGRNRSAPGESTRKPTELLTIVAIGRVPHRVPERIPVGAAVGIAADWITGNSKILERSALKVISYPELAGGGSLARGASIRIDDLESPVERVSHLGSDIRREYELLKPRILGAAITRLITRAAVAEGARRAGQEAGDAGELVGLLAALAAEGALVALDKPDTRSWSFLPNEVWISRQLVSPGEHTLSVQIEGVAENREIQIDVPPGGFSAIVVTVPR